MKRRPRSPLHPLSSPGGLLGFFHTTDDSESIPVHTNSCRIYSDDWCTCTPPDELRRIPHAVPLDMDGRHRNQR